MRIDGFDTPIDLNVRVTIDRDRILSDWAGTSPVDKKGINVPLVYTKAYACYALKCAIAPEIPNNAASLAPFEITAPENSIVNAPAPAPVALRTSSGTWCPTRSMTRSTSCCRGSCPPKGRAACATSR
jgi:N-methylhydantoinase B